MRKLFLILLASVGVLPIVFAGYASAMVILGLHGTFSPGDTAECTIVFGAAVRGHDAPGPAILRRTKAAATLFNEGRVSRIIFTGGKGDDFKESEAAVMQDLAVGSFAIPVSAIEIEENSSSTWENIAYSLPFLRQCSSIVAVSDRYHLARVQLIAEKHSIELETFPAIYVGNTAFEIQSVLREIVGYMYYLLV